MTDRTPNAGAAQAFWDERYGQRPQIWSGNPNFILVREIADLVPGSALDLGCGEGGDAIWLAERGWLVTAVDISGTAISRGRAQAAAVGLADRISWRQHDLSRSFPSGSFDLVSAQYLHSPMEFPRGQVLRAAAGAVAPRGTLLVGGHAEHPEWAEEQHRSHHLPSLEEVLGSLELVPGEWEVQAMENFERAVNDSAGNPAVRVDNVLRLKRM